MAGADGASAVRDGETIATIDTPGAGLRRRPLATGSLAGLCAYDIMAASRELREVRVKLIGDSTGRAQRPFALWLQAVDGPPTAMKARHGDHFASLIAGRWASAEQVARLTGLTPGVGVTRKEVPWDSNRRRAADGARIHCAFRLLRRE